MDNQLEGERLLIKLVLYMKKFYRPMVSEELSTYGNSQELRPFYETLNHYLEKQDMTKSELSGTLQDRKSIYNIYHQENYIPTKRLAICIGLCLKLSKEDFEAYLHDIGYHLSCHIKRDVVILFCLDHAIYEGVRVDLCLEKMQEKPIFSCYS